MLSGPVSSLVSYNPGQAFQMYDPMSTLLDELIYKSRSAYPRISRYSFHCFREPSSPLSIFLAHPAWKFRTLFVDYSRVTGLLSMCRDPWMRIMHELRATVKPITPARLRTCRPHSQVLSPCSRHWTIRSEQDRKNQVAHRKGPQTAELSLFPTRVANGLYGRVDKKNMKRPSADL